MKNPLILVVPALLLSMAASAGTCPADWGKLRPYDLGAEGVGTLEPVAVKSCADLEGMSADQQKKFWDIRKALIQVPTENVTAAQLPAILKTSVKEPDAPQFFTAYERYRIKRILIGKDLCVTMDACKKSA